MSNKNNLVELLKNISFLSWLKKEDGMDSAHWEKWQQENEENRQLAADAKMLKKGIPFKKQQVDKAKMKASWHKLATKLDESTSPQATIPQISPKSPARLNWLKIAATIAIIVCAVWGITAYLNQAELVHHQTDFAQHELIYLPDGSEVVLAANSSLSYYDDLVEKEERKVELIGEAYFKVASQPAGKQFMVDLKDLSVTVIGTAFNVNSHRENSIISLLEGKVALNKTGVKTEQLLPGQTAIFNTATAEFDLFNNQTNYWMDWRFQKWSFGDGMPMQEIIQRIEETFGLSVQLEDTAILAKKASGSIAIDNQEVLFESLSYLLSVDFKLDGNTLLISQKIEH